MEMKKPRRTPEQVSMAKILERDTRALIRGLKALRLTPTNKLVRLRLVKLSTKTHKGGAK